MNRPKYLKFLIALQDSPYLHIVALFDYTGCGEDGARSVYIRGADARHGDQTQAY